MRSRQRDGHLRIRHKADSAPRGREDSSGAPWPGQFRGFGRADIYQRRAEQARDSPLNSSRGPRWNDCTPHLRHQR